MTTSRIPRGFTLLELLIAITIFAIVGVLAMGGYNQLIRQREIAATTMERVRNLQRCVMRVSQDLEQMAARPIRDATSATDMPALLSTNEGSLIEFTHAGWTNPTGINRSTLQRVRYRLVDNKLYRDYWSVLDRTLNSAPIEVQLLDKVTSVTFRFMDSGHQWQTTWPATQAAPVNGIAAPSFASRQLPMAIEITINLQDWGEIKRLVEVPNL